MGTPIPQWLVVGRVDHCIYGDMVLTDPIVVTTHDRGLPTGITEEGMYRLNLAAVSSKSARF